MAEATDVGTPVDPLFVVDGEVYNFSVELCGAKEEIKVPKRVKVSKEGSSVFNICIVITREHLGTAERIFESLIQYPTKNSAKEFIGNVIEEAHGLLFHRVDEA